MNRHSYAFQPFGFAGGRKCPGYRLSYVESTVLLSDILRNFKVCVAMRQACSA